MSNLSDLKAAGGSGKSIKLVASGALSNGNKVVLQSDGTVKVVAVSPTSTSSPVTFNSASITTPAAVFDPVNSKVVMFYQDKVSSPSNYGRSVVGTVSGSSISFGSEVTFSSGSVNYIEAVHYANTGKIVVVYQDNANSNYGTAKVGTVSGTSISFGSASVYNSGSQSIQAVTVDTTNDKVVIGYRDNGNGGYGTGVVGTVSGTSISFGSETLITSSNSAGKSVGGCVFDSSSGKVVMAYQDLTSPGYYSYAVVATVSGTSISFGTPVVISSTNASPKGALFHSPTNQVIIGYVTSGNNSKFRVGSVSGTSISFGAESSASSWVSGKKAMCLDADNNVIASFRDASSGWYGKFAVGTVSGTTMTWTTPALFSSSIMQSSQISSAYDLTNNKAVIMYQDANDNDYGKCNVVGLAGTNLTATNFLGIAEGAAADTATATVMLRGGITTTQSGLTPGSTYYVQGDGTLSTTADSPSVVAGQAISTTTLLIEGES
jgi:hypothetical protein